MRTKFSSDFGPDFVSHVPIADIALEQLAHQILITGLIDDLALEDSFLDFSLVNIR